MKRLLTAVSLAALMVLGVAGPASASPASTTLHLKESHDVVTFVDNPPPGPSIGDELAGNGELHRHGSRVGHIDFHCTSVDSRDRTFLCDATFNLPNGTISISGIFHIRNSVNTFAVIGGTGAYAGASGTASMTSNGSSSSWIIQLT